MTHLRFAALLSFVVVGCSGSTGTLFQAETVVPDGPVGTSDGGASFVDGSSPAIIDEPDSTPTPTPATDGAASDAGADAHLDAATADVESPHDSGTPPPDAGKCDPLIKSIACGLQAMAANGCGDYYACTTGCGLSLPDATDDPSCTTADGGTGWRYSCSAAADMPASCTKIAPHLSCCPTPRSGVPFVN